METKFKITAHLGLGVIILSLVFCNNPKTVVDDISTDTLKIIKALPVIKNYDFSAFSPTQREGNLEQLVFEHPDTIVPEINASLMIAVNSINILQEMHEILLTEYLANMLRDSIKKKFYLKLSDFLKRKIKIENKELLNSRIRGLFPNIEPNLNSCTDYIMKNLNQVPVWMADTSATRLFFGTEDREYCDGVIGALYTTGTHTENGRIQMDRTNKEAIGKIVYMIIGTCKSINYGKKKYPINVFFKETYMKNILIYLREIDPDIPINPIIFPLNSIIFPQLIPLKMIEELEKK